MTKLNLLGYSISHQEGRPDQERLQALLDMKPPNTNRELKRAIGLFSYYARWIENVLEKAAPLLICETLPLQGDALKSFTHLKSELERASLGAIKDKLPFEVETDASNYAIAALLSQNGRPVAYFSRTLNKTKKCYPAIEKEATAVIEAVRKWSRWSHFLLGKHFTLYSDERSVSFMFDGKSEGKIKSNKILSWKIELNQFSYDIKHKPGKLNVAPDALPRTVSPAIAVSKRILHLHNQLGHPGFARFYHFIKSRNLPFTGEETKKACQACKTCAELKPRYFKPPRGQLIKAMKPFKRISMDFKDPLS